jgi:shikimate kinase
MGSGKSTVGRRLASALHLPFCDADTEIERAAGETISEIFELRGEETFRSGEAKVIARLLNEKKCVLATGGGAFMNEATREIIRTNAISVWLKADLDLLMSRVLRRDTRPLLQSGDPEETMQRLMDERYPIYAEANLTIVSQAGPHAITIKTILKALEEFLEEPGLGSRRL